MYIPGSASLKLPVSMDVERDKKLSAALETL